MGVDLDGCIYNWYATFRFLANHYLNANLPPVEQVWNGKQTDADFLTPDQQLWLWTHGVERGLFRYGHVYKGAVEALRRLAEIVDPVIVTHRPNSLSVEVPPEARRTAVLDTMDWIAFLRLPISEVHMLLRAQPKSSVPCDVFLDDGVHVVEDLLRNTDATILLWDRPWNRTNIALPPGRPLWRVDDWKDVIDIVEHEASNVS